MRGSQLKLRKSLNISIQSKRFYIPINEIIAEWEEKGLSPSTKVCEALLLGYKLSNSVELSKLVNTFEMISKTLSHYYNEENTQEYMEAIENVLNKVINVDGEKLSEFLSNPEKFSSKDNTNSQPTQKQTTIEPTKKVEPKFIKTEIVEELAVSQETDITAKTDLEGQANIIKSENVHNVHNEENNKENSEENNEEPIVSKSLDHTKARDDNQINSLSDASGSQVINLNDDFLFNV